MFTHMIGYWAKSNVRGYTESGIAEVVTQTTRRPSWAHCHEVIPGYIKGDYLGIKEAQQIAELALEDALLAVAAYVILDEAAARAVLDAVDDNDPEIYTLAVPEAPTLEDFEGEAVIKAIGKDAAVEFWPLYAERWRDEYETHVVRMACDILGEQ